MSAFIMEKLEQYFKSRDIPLEYLTPLSCRYLRLRRKLDLGVLAQALGLQEKLVETTALEDVVRIPVETKVNNCQPFVKGDIAGIDYSSCLVVRALSLAPQHRVLDLCCAPGAKLAYICDQAKDAVGVDISGNRINTCRGILTRLGLKNFTLVNQDGCSFKSEVKFQRVLVDVQCTHEVSAKHLLKFCGEGGLGRKRKISKSKQSQAQLARNNPSPYCDPVLHPNDWSE